MNVFAKALHWVFGNGYDLAKDEDTVRRHKDDAKECMKTSETHFSLMGEKFNDVTPDPDDGGDGLDERPSTWRGADRGV